MSKDLVINRTPGRPFGTTKYDESVHVQLLYDVFSSGRGVMGFCAEASICRKTFFNWLKQNKEFKKVYDIVINIAGDKWEQLPLKLLNEGKPFNYQYWHLIMRNRFHYSGLNIPKIKNKTTDGKFKAAWKGLERGSLSSQEYSQIMAGVVNELRAKEIALKNKELELRQKELESKKAELVVGTEEDEALELYILGRQGKAKLVEENGKKRIVMVEDETA